MYSWFSAVGIAQPDTALMSRLINLGAVPGFYDYIDETQASDVQIKQLTTFFNSINKEVFDKTQGITLTLVDEVLFVPVNTQLSTNTMTTCSYKGQFFNTKDVTYKFKRLSYDLGNSTLLSNITVKQKKIPIGA